MLVGSLAAALTIRYVWPHASDAQPVASTPARDQKVLREVLREVRVVATEHEAAEDSDDPAVDADGLTEDQRLESDLAVIEDRPPRGRGRLAGAAKDDAGEGIDGVVVVAASATVDGTQTAITDEHGFYALADLPAGDYHVTFYYGDVTVEHPSVRVADGKTTPAFQNITIGPPDYVDVKGEVIELEGQAPVIDTGTAVIGVTITDDYVKNIPVGRTFEAVLGAAADEQEDAEGEYYLD